MLFLAGHSCSCISWLKDMLFLAVNSCSCISCVKDMLFLAVNSCSRISCVKETVWFSFRTNVIPKMKFILLIIQYLQYYAVNPATPDSKLRLLFTSLSEKSFFYVHKTNSIREVKCSAQGRKSSTKVKGGF